MAEQNTIKLVDEITKQRNNDLIIFTTYTFDPIFFDVYILRKLRDKNPNAAIIVLMDSKLKSKLDEKKDFTNESGVSYALIPISGNLFHPKIFMFGKEKKESNKDPKPPQIFLGSHNLTNSGLAVNLELCFSSNDTVLFDNCIDYVHSLLKENLGNPDHELLKKIEPYLGNSKTKKQRLLTNENEPILDKCIKDVSNQLESIDEIIIFSPFFSKTEILIEKIMTLKPNVIKLCIQKDNHNLDPSKVGSFDKLKLNEVKNKRTLHSKFIVFKSPDQDLVLLGSPNFTRPALLETNSEDGNFESAILWEQNSDDFINHLEIKPISENEVKTSQRKFDESEGSQTKTDVTISFAYIDNYDKLQIDYNSKIEKSVKLEFYDEDQVQIDTRDFQLEKKEHSIPISSISSKIKEICFTENNERISNLSRVCNLQIALKSKSVLNFNDEKIIDDLFSNNSSFEGLENILSDITTSLSNHSEDSESSQESESNQEDEYDEEHEDDEFRPSGIRNISKLNNTFLDSIRKILSISVKTQTHSISEQKHGQITNSKNPKNNETVKKIMEMLKDFFKKNIIYWRSKPILYSLFLKCELYCLSLIESKNKEQAVLSAKTIQYLNEIIKEDKFFSERNIDKIKIWASILTLTKLYHKNLNLVYPFDNAEILCAFKPLFKQEDTTYEISPKDFFTKIENQAFIRKNPTFKNKIDSQSKFVVDDEKIMEELDNISNTFKVFGLENEEVNSQDN